MIECTTAEAAELVLSTTGIELRALVTDVHLDGEMTGIELAEYAQTKYPALNVVVMSGTGYAEPAERHAISAEAVQAGRTAGGYQLSIDRKRSRGNMDDRD